MENMVPRKAELQSWGHSGKSNVLPNIVKLLNIHRRLTRQKMRMDNLSLRRNVLAHFGKMSCAIGFYKGLEKRQERSCHRLDRALNDSYR